MKTRHQLISVLVAVGLILAILVPTVLAEYTNEDIKALYQGDKAFAYIEALVGFGPRVAGGDAERAAADYIADEMESYGLDVEIQMFDIYLWEEVSMPVLEQISPNPTVYPPYDLAGFATMLYSGSGDVTALVQPTVDIMIPPGPNADDSNSGCEAEDFAGFAAGNIALIQRGSCSFFQKAMNAQNAGAVGVIIFNEGQPDYIPSRTDAFLGTLGGPGVNIPVVGTAFAVGEELYNLTLGGDVTVQKGKKSLQEQSQDGVVVHMFVDAILEERESQNVIGTLEGLEPDQGIVYIGGHYDSVSAGPGANDDASGVAATLEAARLLGTTGHRTKATLKFIAFGAEETGLDGSYNYVVANIDEVYYKGIGMINLDMIGVGDTLQIGNMGLSPPDLTDYAGEKAEAWGLDPEPFTARCNSDHCYFEQVGVPVAFLTQRPDPWYHTPEDTPDKIDHTVLEDNGELATATLYDWAKNPALREKKAAKVKKVHVYHDQVLAAD